MVCVYVDVQCSSKALLVNATYWYLILTVYAEGCLKVGVTILQVLQIVQIVDSQYSS